MGEVARSPVVQRLRAPEAILKGRLGREGANPGVRAPHCRGSDRALEGRGRDRLELVEACDVLSLRVDGLLSGLLDEGSLLEGIGRLLVLFTHQGLSLRC